MTIEEYNKLVNTKTSIENISNQIEACEKTYEYYKGCINNTGGICVASFTREMKFYGYHDKEDTQNFSMPLNKDNSKALIKEVYAMKKDVLKQRLEELNNDFKRSE